MQRKSCLRFALVAAVLGMAEGSARTVSVVAHFAGAGRIYVPGEGSVLLLR